MEEKEEISIDTIILELGDFGRYQKINLLLICVPMIYTAFATLNYIFTTGNPGYRSRPPTLYHHILLHRCRIPECEATNSTDYQPEWLSRAVPTERSAKYLCKRYQPVYQEGTFFNETNCPAWLFNKQELISCNDFIFAPYHRTIVNDYKLTCIENQWKLTLAGTMSSFGQFVCLPISGYMSDRFGRRKIMICCLLFTTVIGLCRSMAPTYAYFILLEFMDTALGAGAYSAGFVLGVELVGPSKRVFAGTVISSCDAVGAVIMGVIAWATVSWRQLLRVMYIPGILFIWYYWLIPESPRWLQVKNHVPEFKKLFQKVAKTNKTTISEKTMTFLGRSTVRTERVSHSILQIFKFPVLLKRFLNCSACWITCNMVYFGLSLNSVGVAGNIYLNFILVALIEIPGYMLTNICLNKLGRRSTLSGSLFTAGIACVTFIFVPDGIGWLKLILYLAGKCAVTIAFTAIYFYTTELFPTPLRHSVLGTCSMFGRIGGMIAPQTPLIAILWSPLPLLIFGCLATLSGICVLAFPETLHMKLPETIDDAINIGIKNIDESASDDRD